MQGQDWDINIYTDEESIEYKRFQSTIDVLKNFKIFTLKHEKPIIHVVRPPHLHLKTVLDMMDSITVRVLEFAKLTPEFMADPQHDQITYFKNGGRDTMIFWMARRYNTETDSMVSFNNESWSCEYFATAHFEDVLDDFLELSQLMHRMRIDDIECAFLGILALSAEHSLMEIEGHNLKNARDLYMRILKDYITINYGQKGPERFAKLLTILPKLRLLCNGFDKVFLNIRNGGRSSFPFLLTEVWNLF